MFPLARHWKLLLLAIPLVAMVVLALLSDGVMQNDDLTHYLMARWSWQFPMYLVDGWGRPGFTVPYAIVANLGSPEIGFTVSRLLTVATCAASAWLTWQVAKTLVDEPYAWLAPLALLTMPLYVRLGYTTLTETTAAFYAILGTWLFTKDRIILSAVVFSLVPLTRHEGILLLPAVGLLLLWRKAWWALPFLLTGEVAWNIAKPILDWPVTELPIWRFASRGDPGHLGSGGPLHYVGMSIHAFGPIAAMLAVAGTIALMSQLQRINVRQASITLLVAGGFVAMLLLQTVLYAINTHESGGYARFLIPVAPWAAVCVAGGVRAVLHADPTAVRRYSVVMLAWLCLAMLGLWQHGWSVWFMLTPIAVLPPLVLTIRPHRLQLAIFLAVGVTVAVLVKDVRPHTLRPHERAVVLTAEQLRLNHPDANLVGDNPWIDYASDTARHPYFWAANDWRDHKHPPLIYLWDEHHSSINLPLHELRTSPHVELEPPPLPDDAAADFVRIFKREP